MNPDRSKLSKRQGDVAVEDYIKKGYLKEALLNFVALLGWNPKADQELYTLDELIALFDLAKVNKGGAMLNLEKLDWMNGHYIRTLPIETLTQLCLPYFPQEAKSVPPDMIRAIVALEQERLKTPAEIGARTAYFFTPELTYDPKLLVWKKMTVEGVLANLARARDLLQKLEGNAWSEPTIERTVREFLAAEKIGTGELLWPFRVALTGQKASPPPFPIATILGRERTLARIDRARSLLSVAQ